MNSLGRLFIDLLLTDYSNKKESGQMKVELYMDNEPLDARADRRILTLFNIRDKTVSGLIG